MAKKRKSASSGPRQRKGKSKRRRESIIGSVKDKSMHSMSDEIGVGENTWSTTLKDFRHTTKRNDPKTSSHALNVAMPEINKGYVEPLPESRSQEQEKKANVESRGGQDCGPSSGTTNDVMEEGSKGFVVPFDGHASDLATLTVRFDVETGVVRKKRKGKKGCTREEDTATPLKITNVLMTEESRKYIEPVGATESQRGSLALLTVESDKIFGVVRRKRNVSKGRARQKYHGPSSETSRFLMEKDDKDYVETASRRGQRSWVKVECATKTSMTRKRKKRPRKWLSRKPTTSNSGMHIVLALKAVEMDSKRRNTSTNNSSSIRGTDVGPNTKNSNVVTADDNMMLSTKGKSLLESINADIMKKPDMPPGNNLTSNDDKGTGLKMYSRRRKKGNNPTNAMTCPSSNVASASNLSFSEIFELVVERKADNETSTTVIEVPVEKEISDLASGSSKTGKLSEINDPDIFENNNKGNKKAFDCCQYNLEVDGNCYPNITSPLVELVGKDSTSTSVRNDHMTCISIENNGLLVDCNSSNGSGSFPHVAQVSFQVEDPSSAHITDRKQTDKNSNCCASPIRGVVHDCTLMDVPIKQSNQSDSLSEAKVSQSGNGVKSEEVSDPNAIDSTLHVTPSSTHNQSTDGLMEKRLASSFSSDVAKLDIPSDICKSEDEKLECLPVFPERAFLKCTRKKLLVLDLNGLLADIVPGFRDTHKAFIRVRGKSVFKRPFCDDFLKFCFERFDIGVWSSRKRCNVDDVLDYLMGDAKEKLLFCWDQAKCNITSFRTIENIHKPLVLKELKKLWNNEGSDLPWKTGDYSPSNTLLVDDSPYKALLNPAHTAIFPQPYRFDDESDNSLGPGGDLRVYLEGLAMADDVQQHVERHHFGQHAITASHPCWDFYCKVIKEVEGTSHR